MCHVKIRDAEWRIGRLLQNESDRVIYITPGFQLIAIDAKSGHLDSGFR